MTDISRIMVVLTPEADEPWVVDAAAQLARETDAGVTVLAVDDVESERYETIPREESLAQAQQLAARAQERLTDVGVEATALARSGPALETVLEEADAGAADIIVVGASQRPAIVERVLGSLPIQLIQRSRRQVLVVTQPAA